MLLLHRVTSFCFVRKNKAKSCKQGDRSTKRHFFQQFCKSVLHSVLQAYNYIFARQNLILLNKNIAT
jgi:hypothetical protein